MFFILSKILSFLLQPLSWVFLLLLAAWIFPRKKSSLLRSALIFLLIFSNRFLADEAMRALETKAFPDHKISHHNLAIVLGGMSGWDPKLGRIQFRDGSDRLWQALRLQSTGKVKTLVVTGGSASLILPQYKESDYIKQYLQGIKYSYPVYYENQSRNTFENAAFTKKLLNARHLSEPILLITSASHMPRAKAVFQKQGYRVTPYVTDRHSGPRKFTFDHLLIPSSEALNTWNKIFREITGLAAYKFQGYL